jgi:hypothetical protein
MTRDQRGLSDGSQVIGTRPCPGGDPDHVVLELTDDEARRAGLPPGQPIHVDRSRQPTTGDLVWVELVRHGSTQRLVRRFARDSGWVTLSAPGGGSAAVMRRQAELLVLGVVDDSARCATAPPGG